MSSCSVAFLLSSITEQEGPIGAQKKLLAN
jgi:hypothetical protein